MKSVLDPIRRAIQAKADEVLQQLGRGGFVSLAQAEGLAQRRKGMLEALEIVNAQAKKADIDNDD